MKNYWIGIIVVAIVLAAGCQTDKQARRGGGVDYWAKHKGNCEQILTAPHAYGLDQITQCTKLWEMYRNVGPIPLQMRSMYAIGFSKVSHLSTVNYDRAVADAALRRLCIPRHPIVNGQIQERVPRQLECEGMSANGIGGSGMQSSNPYERLRRSVQVVEVDDRNMGAAKKMTREGMRAYKKKHYGDAVNKFDSALEKDPFNVDAQYNRARALALMGQEDDAIASLEKLYSWDDHAASERLIMARSEEAFEILHDNLKFKLLTGFMRITLANGAGQIGLERVKSIKDTLEKHKFSVADTRSTSKPQLMPIILHKPGYDAYAERIKGLLAVKDVLVKTIDYETIDDIIVIWRQPEAANMSGAGQSAPVVQGERAQGGNLLDDMTKNVKDAKGSAKDAKETGQGLAEF